MDEVLSWEETFESTDRVWKLSLKAEREAVRKSKLPASRARAKKEADRNNYIDQLLVGTKADPEGLAEHEWAELMDRVWKDESSRHLLYKNKRGQRIKLRSVILSYLMHYRSGVGAQN